MGESPLLAALSRACVGRLHRTVLTTVSFLFFFDLADLNTFAFAAPAILRAHLFSVQDVAFVTATSFAGMALGAIVGGRLADTFGRRRGLLVSVLLFSTSSLVNALVSTTDLMAAARFATGLGLGAMTSIAITYLSEITPAARRGRFQATALGTGLIGIPVVAFGIAVAALGVCYGLSSGTAAIMTFGLLVAALSQTYIAVLYSYTPEPFPTRLRTAGSGLQRTRQSR
jgi:putative MFS transporter